MHEVLSRTLNNSTNAAGVFTALLLEPVREDYLRRLLGVQLSSGEIGAGDLVTLFLASGDGADGGTNTAQFIMDHPQTFIAQIRDNQLFTPPEHPLHGIIWQGELHAGIQDASGGNGTLHCTIFYTLEKISRAEWLMHQDREYWTRRKFES